MVKHKKKQEGKTMRAMLWLSAALMILAFPISYLFQCLIHWLFVDSLTGNINAVPDYATFFDIMITTGLLFILGFVIAAATLVSRVCYDKKVAERVSVSALIWFFVVFFAFSSVRSICQVLTASHPYYSSHAPAHQIIKAIICAIFCIALIALDVKRRRAAAKTK